MDGYISWNVLCKSVYGAYVTGYHTPAVAISPSQQLIWSDNLISHLSNKLRDDEWFIYFIYAQFFLVMFTLSVPEQINEAYELKIQWRMF